MRLLIIDDKLVCESLRMIVEIGSARISEAVEVVGIGHDGYAAMAMKSCALRFARISYGSYGRHHGR